MFIKPQWIIFDVGGVIFDYRKAFKNVASYLKVPDQQLLDEFYAALGPGELGEITFEDLFANTLKKMNKSHEHTQVFSLWWNVEHWVEDTKKLLHELHTAQYSLALFTNNWVGMGDKTRESFDNPLIISHMFESSIEKLRKPDPTFYTLIENTLNLSGPELFFIDDTKENIQTAEKLGWQTFLYNLGDDNGKSANKLLRDKLL